MLNRLRYYLGQFAARFRRFMYGRNGSDGFNIFLLIAYFIVSAAASFFTGIPLLYAVIYLLSYIPLGFFFWRFCSKNLAARQLENERFLNWWYPKRHAFIQWKNRLSDRDHRYVKCKKCHQRLRLPKHRGTLMVTCPKCRYQFSKKT